MQAIPIKRRVANPQPGHRPKKKKRSASAHRHSAPAKKPKKRKSKNPLAVVGALNGKGAKMATSKKRKKKPAAKRSNPQRGGHSKKKKGGKRNPQRSSAGGQLALTRPAGMAKAALAILAGLLGARQLPQLVLAEQNAGTMGYAANLGSSLLLGFAVAMGFNRFYGFLAAAGGVAYTASRVATEKFSPIGKALSLSGVGDAHAAGFGVLKSGSFPVPAVVDKNGRLLIPQDYLDQVRAMIAAENPGAARAALPASSAAPGMGRMGNRFASRFVS